MKTKKKPNLYLIWSYEHKGWWRAKRCGYTGDFAEAGLYDYEETKEICSKARGEEIGIPKRVIYDSFYAFFSGIAKVAKRHNKLGMYKTFVNIGTAVRAADVLTDLFDQETTKRILDSASEHIKETDKD